MAPTRRIPSPTASRAFVDDLLAELRATRFSGGGWLRLWHRSLERSAEQAAAHRRAEREVHLLHVLAAPFLTPGATILSWWMSWTHLGLLGDEDAPLGWGNRLTVARGLLPALRWQSRPLAALVALATDFADGRLARRSGRTTAFGAFADPVADAVFWTWFALTEEPDAVLRALAVTLWMGPPAALAVAYFTRAEAIGIPASVNLRPLSAALQITLTGRSLWRRRPRR